MAPVPATGMTGEFRTAEGGRVDRAKPIPFIFDGKPYDGLAGDTLATALIANGVHLMGRSFKYHRPRGPLSLGSDEPNALVDARRRQGSRHAQSARDADRALRGPEGALAKRLAVAAMGCDGGQRPRVGVVSRRLLLQDLHRPAGRLGEPLRAGDPSRGRPRRRARASRTPTITASNIAIAKSRSSAPARPGLAAALAAARAGARVILFDEQAEFGGSLLAETQATIDGRERRRMGRERGRRTRGRAARDAAAAHAGVRLLRTELPRRRSSASPIISPNPDPRLPRERLWQVRAKHVVLATGAHERPLVFPDNDRPGIMLAESARALATRYGVRPGAKVVVAASHDGAYRAALDLARAGCEIVMIADLRATADGALPRMARRDGAARRDARGDPRLARRPARDPRARRAALVGRTAGQARRDRLRRDRDERRLDAERAPLLAIARQARVRRGDADVPARRGRASAGQRRGLPRRVRSRGRARGRREGGGGSRGRDGAGRRRASRARSPRRAARWASSRR